MPSQPAENYLKAMLSLSTETGEVSITELAVALDVSKSAANGMVKSLAAEGLVRYVRYKPLQLTPTGRKAAALIIRKHRLTEMYLVERMGFGWDEVHPIAEQMEHLDAPQLFDRMDELLGHPTVDPHGSPIPSLEGEIATQDFHKLSEVAQGTRARLRAVVSDDDQLLSYLNRKQIALETLFEVVDVEPFDGSVRVRYGAGRDEVLSREVADRLLV